MKKRIFCLFIAVILSSSLPAGQKILWVAEGHAADKGGPTSSPAKTDASGPVACVQTAPLRKGTITENIVVYGSVIAAPGALQTVSAPFESQALSIMVSQGQKVSKGDILLRIRPSPDSMLQLNQAQNAYKLAQQSYQEMERLRKLKLATNEQMIQAKQTLDQAKLRLESLRKRGINGERKMASSVDGLVKKIYVQEGSIVPAGSPMMDIVAEDRVEVLLGVEPEDIGRIHPDQAVSLTRVNAPASSEASGKVRKISYAVDPTTRLVDVFVALTSPASFLLGESVEGRIVISAAQGLIVPRSAVLPEGDRHVLFKVKDGRAVKHTVEIVLENAEKYQIVGKNLQAGEEVVVLGNYELADGMPVSTGACK